MVRNFWTIRKDSMSMHWCFKAEPIWDLAWTEFFGNVALSLGAVFLQSEDSIKIGRILGGLDISMGVELDGKSGRGLVDKDDLEEVVEFAEEEERIVSGRRWETLNGKKMLVCLEFEIC